MHREEGTVTKPSLEFVVYEVLMFYFLNNNQDLTPILLTWRIARKWQMGFNSAFKGLSVPQFVQWVLVKNVGDARIHCNISIVYLISILLTTVS